MFFRILADHLLQKIETPRKSPHIAIDSTATRVPTHVVLKELPSTQSKSLSPSMNNTASSVSNQATLSSKQQSDSKKELEDAQNVTEDMIVPPLTQAGTRIQIHGNIIVILINGYLISEKTRMEQKAGKISSDDLLAFLKSLGLDDSTISTVNDLEIDATTLYYAMDDDSQLIDIGIRRAYLRLKFKILFKRLLLEETTRIGEIFTTAKVVEFCNKNKATSKFSKVQ